MEGFESYLHSKYRSSTVRSILSEVRLYLKESDVRLGIYERVLAYLSLKRKYRKELHGVLRSLRIYYDYLLLNGLVSVNAARSIRLRERTDRSIIFGDLLSLEELAGLLVGWEDSRYRYRNELLMSLLVYQGLSRIELMQLQVSDIDLRKGKVYIRSSYHRKGRLLSLEGVQVYVLMEYLNKERALLNVQHSELLLLSYQGGNVKYLVPDLLKSRQGAYLGKRLSIERIRQSVLVAKFDDGLSIKSVQLFSGLSSMEQLRRYDRSRYSDLQASLSQYHPLG